jgi:hypothetical protein
LRAQHSATLAATVGSAKGITGNLAVGFSEDTRRQFVFNVAF